MLISERQYWEIAEILGTRVSVQETPQGEEVHIQGDETLVRFQPHGLPDKETSVDVVVMDERIKGYYSGSQGAQKLTNVRPYILYDRKSPIRVCLAGNESEIKVSIGAGDIDVSLRQQRHWRI